VSEGDAMAKPMVRKKEMREGKKKYIKNCGKSGDLCKFFKPRQI
jgi:hypothetical protein